MAFKEKFIAELKAILFTSLYFFFWFGALMLIKVLLLRQYHIEFYGFTIVVIGTLVIAKVVLLLEYVPIPFTKNKPYWAEVLVRTFLYLIGVAIVMALEKSFETRHEHGGFTEAFFYLVKHNNAYQLWVNVICVSGALLFYNIWTVFKINFGAGVFWNLMKAKTPQ